MCVCVCVCVGWERGSGAPLLERDRPSEKARERAHV